MQMLSQSQVTGEKGNLFYQFRSSTEIENARITDKIEG